MRRLGLLYFVATVATLALGSDRTLAQSYDNNVPQRYNNGKAHQSERDEQAALFDYFFGDRRMKYETKLANLKQTGSVPSWRTPYSAAIHPQSAGGLSDAVPGSKERVRFPGARIRGRRSGGEWSSSRPSSLSLYDRAFSGGQNVANSWEVRRIVGHRNEAWEGYCSGFTASTIKHPEPVRAVDAGQVGGARGIVFQPSDIKALLSCIYNRTTDDSFLLLAAPSASDGGPNMGTFHLAITNYIGQAGYPVGIDTTKGEEAWNYPIYAYSADSIEDAGASDNVRFKEVQMTVTMTDYGSDDEIQTNSSTGAREGNEKLNKTYRYTLALDIQGNIIGGNSKSDSGHFLWLPLYAPQAKADATVQGNPYVDVRKVIAMARLSALPAMQKRYDEATIGPNIDPAVAQPASAAENAPKQDVKKAVAANAETPKEDSTE